jgi:hypothetical protein
MNEKMQIGTYDQYLDFIDYLELDKPRILEISKPYVITEHYDITVDRQFSYVFDDLVEWLTGGEMKTVVRCEEEPEPITLQELLVEIKPERVIEVEGITLNVY